MVSTAHAVNPTAALRLVDGFSLEMTGKDVPGLEEARHAIPAGTKINVTFLGNEDLEMRVAAAKAVKDLGFVPVPHISARRLKSQDQLEEFLGRLQEVGATEHVFAVGGDPAEPEGPYPDSLSVIRTGLLQKYGVREVSIAGYPEGHPDIKTDVLWRHLEDKSAALKEQGLDAVILTQFAFDTDPVMAWIKEVRESRHPDADPRRHAGTGGNQAPARLRPPLRHRRERDDREEVRLLADQPDGHRWSRPVRERPVEPARVGPGRGRRAAALLHVRRAARDVRVGSRIHRRPAVRPRP